MRDMQILENLKAIYPEAWDAVDSHAHAMRVNTGGHLSAPSPSINGNFGLGPGPASVSSARRTQSGNFFQANRLSSQQLSDAVAAEEPWRRQHDESEDAVLMDCGGQMLSEACQYLTGSSPEGSQS